MIYTFFYEFGLPIVLLMPFAMFVACTYFGGANMEATNKSQKQGEHVERTFTMNIITLFTGEQVSRVVTAAADILTLAEEVCNLCSKPVGTLRLVSDANVIDPWCNSWKNATFGDLNVFEDKTMFVYFLPEHNDHILTSLGPDGSVDAWAEAEQKLRQSKRLSKNLQTQCSKVEKEKNEISLKHSRALEEKQKILLKHGDMANMFANSKKKLKTQSANHRSEVKKLQFEKRNLLKQFETNTQKLQDVLRDRDRLTTAERNLKLQIDKFHKDQLMYLNQFEQINAEKEELQKENAYLKQRLKSLSYANASIDHHYHHHHHHLPESSFQRPSSTPSVDSFHSLALSDHSNPQNSELSSGPLSSASSGNTSPVGNDRSLKIIDDSHYASPTLLPAVDPSTHRYQDLERYEVPSFIQDRASSYY